MKNERLFWEDLAATFEFAAGYFAVVGMALAEKYGADAGGDVELILNFAEACQDVVSHLELGTLGAVSIDVYSFEKVSTEEFNRAMGGREGSDIPVGREGADVRKDIPF